MTSSDARECRFFHNSHKQQGAVLSQVVQTLPFVVLLFSERMEIQAKDKTIMKHGPTLLLAVSSNIRFACALALRYVFFSAFKILS